MTLIEACKKVYFEDIFKINGRASRKEFWGADLIFLPTIFLIIFLSFFISDGLGDLIGNIATLWVFVGTFTVSIRRAHDTGKSGWFTIIPFYNLIIYLTPSSQTSNQWGDPRPHTVVSKEVIDDSDEK